MAMERTMSVPITQPRTIRTAVNDFRTRALTNSHSLGSGKKAFGFGLLTMVGIPNPSLVGFTAAAYALGKVVGVRGERALVGEIIELAKQPNGLAELKAGMNDLLDVAQQERLTIKLEKQGVAIRDLGLTVQSYRELFGKPRLWSLGAGSQIVNKVWLGVAWGAGMLPVLLGTQPLSAGLVFCSLLTGVMLGAAKIWGTIRENGHVKKLAALVKTDQDRENLKQLMKDEGYSPALQARLTAKLNKRGVNL